MLDLTGTHLGCEHDLCGACTILLNGDAVRSCLLPAVQADGANPMTVEGLLRPLQGRYQHGKYHGIGLGCFVKNTGQGPYEGARAVVNGADNIAVYLGITSLGQGHETTMAQICADTHGVPLESFTVLQGNTDMMPFGIGTFGSRGTVMAGNAVFLSCQKLREKILGEGGIVTTGAALANAVSHALTPLGIHVTELPLSPHRIWALVWRASV